MSGHPAEPAGPAYDLPAPGGAAQQPATPHGPAYNLPAPGDRTTPLEAGLPYQLLHRAGHNAWWRSVLGVISLALLAMLFVPLVLQVLLIAGYAVAGSNQPLDDSLDVLDLSDPSPLGLGYLMVSLAALIPITWLVSWSLHGLKPRWLTSVFPKMRWGYFLACLGLSVVALIATLIVGALMPADAVAGAQETITPNPVDSTMLGFALVVIFLTPLQAAGEEYAFRGYLTQAFGGTLGTYAAVIGPAVLFALAHGSQSLPIFIDRLAFGLVAGVLVVKTGGLEAGIAMHVLNNWLAFGLAIAFGDLGDALQPTGGSWWMLPATLTQSLVYLGLALLVARGMRLRRTADRAVLAAPTPRV